MLGAKVIKFSIDIKMVPYVKDISLDILILDISLKVYTFPSDIVTDDHLQCIYRIHFLPFNDAFTRFCQ